jgi:hypothetical protein
MAGYESSEVAERAGAPARQLVLVTKADTDQATLLRLLRVAVLTADAPATLKVCAIDDANDGSKDMTLTFPVAGVYWERIQVRRVYSTGSTANAVVHGVPAT